MHPARLELLHRLGVQPSERLASLGIMGNTNFRIGKSSHNGGTKSPRTLRHCGIGGFKGAHNRVRLLAALNGIDARPRRGLAPQGGSAEAEDRHLHTPTPDHALTNLPTWNY